MLDSSDFLKDDCLKFKCTVGVVVSAVDCPRLHSVNVPESDIGVHFGMLLESMEGSDITFNVAGEKFAAHKLVLAARSPKFRSKLFGCINEDKEEIIVTDLEPKVFKVDYHHIRNFSSLAPLYPVVFKVVLATCVFPLFILMVICGPKLSLTWTGYAALYLSRYPYR